MIYTEMPHKPELASDRPQSTQRHLILSEFCYTLFFSRLYLHISAYHYHNDPANRKPWPFLFVIYVSHKNIMVNLFVIDGRVYHFEAKLLIHNDIFSRLVSKQRRCLSLNFNNSRIHSVSPVIAYALCRGKHYFNPNSCFQIITLFQTLSKIL